MAKVDVVTIARQYGAGGSDLARALGQSLGWPVLDREIIQTAAERLHADVAHAASLDEHVAKALQSLARGFAMGVPEYAIEPAYELDPDALAKATHQVVVAAVRSAPLIVVGHGVQCLLASRPGTLHVRVVAPAAKRAECVAERLSLDLRTAAAEVQRHDTHRARYLRHHFGADNNDPTLYDVQLNTAHLSIAEIAVAVTQIVRGGA